MEQQTTNFSIVKAKIIKTDELLENYLDKCNKLTKSQKALKDIKSKYEYLSSEVDRLKLENGHITFSLNTIKPKYEALQVSEQDLKIQLADLEERYNTHAIESQLQYQEIEEKYKIDIVDPQSPKKEKACNEELSKLEQKYKEQQSLMQTFELQNAGLQSEIKQMTNEMEKQKNTHDSIIDLFKNDKIKLAAEVKLLKDKNKSLEQCLKRHDMAAANRKQKEAEIQELQKKVAYFTIQKKQLEKIMKENESLRSKLNDLLLKHGKVSIGIQTEEPKMVSMGMNTKDIEEIMELENESLSNIFNEMILPCVLSPMSFYMDENEPIHDFIGTGISELCPTSDKPSTLPTDQIPIESIPQIIVTPPTPNEDSMDKQFIDFDKITACISTQTTIESRDIQIQACLSPKNKKPKNIFSVTTQTDIVESNIKKTCDIQTQTQEDPFERRRRMKLSRRMYQNQNNVIRRNQTRNGCLCSKGDTTNVILKAIKILSDNNISVTISNNNIVGPNFQQRNGINSLNNMNVKIEKSRIEKMTCYGELCEMSNYNMVLDEKQNLLGFINIKEELPTPPNSRQNGKIQNPINNKEKKKKRKRNISSEFSSETDTEIERCFERRKKKNKSNNVDKRITKRRHEKSETDSDIGSIQESSELDFSFEENKKKVENCTRSALERRLPKTFDEKCIKKPAHRKISFNNETKEVSRSYSMESIETLPDINSRVLPNPILISPKKTSTPKRSRKNSRRLSMESLKTPLCKMTPNPKLLTPLSEMSENASPDKVTIENDFRGGEIKSLVDDMEMPEEMLNPCCEIGGKEEFSKILPLDQSDTQNSLQPDPEIDKLKDPVDTSTKVDSLPNSPLSNPEEEKHQPEAKKKRGRPRKVTKLMSNALKLARSLGSIYKDELLCDSLEQNIENKKDIAPGKKITIVQNIVIPPKHRVCVKKFDSSKMVEESGSVGSANVTNCPSDRQESNTLRNIPAPPKRKQKKSNATAQFTCHTTSDITSQIMEEMTKARMGNAKLNTPTGDIVKSSPNRGAGPPISLAKLRVPNGVEGVEEDAEDILECPASPDAEEVPECQPRLIPTVNVAKKAIMPGSKVNVLFDKLIIYSTEERVTDEITSEFLNEDPHYIATLVLDKVSMDVHDKAEHKHPLAPVLTDTQRVLLGFMACLERKHVPAIFERFLQKAETALYDKFIFPTYGLEAIEPIVRLYTAVCKLKKNKNRMRRFCTEAFYFMGDFAIPLFFYVLTMWPEVLPMAAESKGYPLARVMVQICFLKDCNKPGYNLLPLRDLLHKYFGYLSERRDSDEVFNEVLLEYYKNPSSRLNTLSVLVYCKNHPTKWVYQKIKENFIPLVYKIPVENVNLRATILILTSNLCRGFSLAMDDTVIKEMMRWYRSIEEDTSEVIVKNAVYYAVANLPKIPKNIKNKKIVKTEDEDSDT